MPSRRTGMPYHHTFFRPYCQPFCEKIAIFAKMQLAFLRKCVADDPQKVLFGVSDTRLIPSVYAFAPPDYTAARGILPSKKTRARLFERYRSTEFGTLAHLLSEKRTKTGNVTIDFSTERAYNGVKGRPTSDLPLLF